MLIQINSLIPYNMNRSSNQIIKIRVQVCIVSHLILVSIFKVFFISVYCFPDRDSCFYFLIFLFPFAFYSSVTPFCISAVRFLCRFFLVAVHAGPGLHGGRRATDTDCLAVTSDNAHACWYGRHAAASQWLLCPHATLSCYYSHRR